jgi:hypothetical protein
VGVVFDERRVDWPEGGTPAGRLKAFLCAHPVGRELLEDAEPVAGDVHWRRHLACRSERLAGDGFVLVGDAAGFLDPFYSPGMDWVAFTVSRAVDLVGRALSGESGSALAARYEADFRRSYDRWFGAIYRDKYAYLGDFELMRIAFTLDLGLYYLGVASQPYRRGAEALLEPTFVTPPSVPVFHFMQWYNRRLAAMGGERLRRGTFGRANAGRRRLVGGFTFSGRSAFPLVGAVVRWAGLELTEGWRTWFRTGTPLRPAVSTASTVPQPPADGPGPDAVPLVGSAGSSGR